VKLPAMPRQVGAKDHLFGALLAVAYLVLLALTASDLGMSRDEGFYVEAADRYGAWYAALWQEPEQALKQDVIDRYWSYNREHPALIKTLFAWSARLDQRLVPQFREALGFEPAPLFGSPSLGYRFPGMVCGALTLWLIYIFGARAADRRVGMFAALAYASLPRAFYHAHLNCFDVPIVLMVTWTLYAYWRSLLSPWWAVWVGLAFGCALATKHNSWILPGICLVHWAWVAGEELSRRRRQQPPRLVLTPYWLLGMAVIGPVVFVGSWPYIWFDSWERVSAYAAFHLRHDYYNIAYFGVNYFRPPFPWSFPFVMTAITVPFTYLLLMLLGLALRARALVPAWLPLRFLPRGELTSDLRATDALWLGAALAPLLLIALPSTPIFGGTKHWLTAYPFLCLFAGYAALHVIVSLETRLVRQGVTDPGPLALLCMGLLVAPGVAETSHSHPFGLSHYTLAAGGVPGAADLGMNRQFWGFTTGSAAAFLRQNLPFGGSVFLHDTTHTAFEMLKRDGLLPRNIRAARHLSEADYVLVHHEDHMAEVDFQAWELFGTTQPAHVITHDGVPIVSIYAHPRKSQRQNQAKTGRDAASVRDRSKSM
jgi:hypothetical protein